MSKSSIQDKLFGLGKRNQPKTSINDEEDEKQELLEMEERAAGGWDPNVIQSAMP